MYVNSLPDKDKAIILPELNNMRSWCDKHNIKPYKRDKVTKYEEQQLANGAYYRDAKGTIDSKPFGTAVLVPVDEPNDR